MGYWLEATAAASTAKADAEEDTARVHDGIITQIWVLQPPGSAALGYFRVLVAGHQIFPKQPGKWFHGDRVNQAFPIFYKVTGGPRTIKLQLYNEDTVFSHSVYVDVTVLPEWVALPMYTFGKLLEKFFKLLGVGG